MSAADTISPVVVAWQLPWGPVVRGLRWAGGADRVLFLHEPGADLDAWGTLAATTAAQLGVDAISVDLPGHGLSDDPWQPERLEELISYLTRVGSERSRRCVVAAGPTALAVLTAAADLGLDGVVAFSPLTRPEKQRLQRSPRVAKLFLAGSLAGDDLRAARRIAADCGGWAVVTSVPVSATGTAMLATARGAQLTGQVISFLRDCLRPRLAPGARIDAAQTTTNADFG